MAQKPTGKRAAQKARTRARLLESALELFRERGYEEFSVETLSSRAGLSRVGFYLHFPSIGALARELVTPTLLELMDHYRLLDELALDQASLREWSVGLLELWRHNEVRIRIGEYVVAVDPELRGLWASGMDDVATLMPRYLHRWEMAGRGAVGLLRLTAHLLQHERLCYLVMSGAGPRDEDVLAELLVEQAWVLLAREASAGTPSFDPDRPGEPRLDPFERAVIT